LGNLEQRIARGLLRGGHERGGSDGEGRGDGGMVEEE
jgi:hypothetical protein